MKERKHVTEQSEREKAERVAEDDDSATQGLVDRYTAELLRHAAGEHMSLVHSSTSAALTMIQASTYAMLELVQSEAKQSKNLADFMLRLDNAIDVLIKRNDRESQGGEKDDA